MNYFRKFLLFLLVLLTVYGRETCLVTNVDCLTNAANEMFNIFVPGIKGLIDPSDPLHLEEVNGFVPDVPYRLSNLTLTGISQCQVSLFRLNIDESTYEYNLLCPRLVLNFHEKAKGFLGPTEMDFDGLSKATYDNYLMKINGSYGFYFNKADHKHHYTLGDFSLETEVQGHFAIDYLSPLHSDETKSDLARSYIQQHSKDMEIYLKSPTMEKFIAKFLNHFDLYLRNNDFEIMVPY